MGFNVPVYDIDNVTWGPGTIKIGVIGETPTVDIGAVTGDHEFLFEEEILPLKAGSPQIVLEQYILSQEPSIKFSGVEWNLDALNQFLGSGSTSFADPTETFKYGGGQTKKDSYAILYTHRTACGGTVEFEIYKASGAGSLAIALKETEFHEFPYEFKILEGTTNFADEALVEGNKLVSILKTDA